MNREEFKKFFNENINKKFSKNNVSLIIKSKYPIIYNFVLNETSYLDDSKKEIKFTERIYNILYDIYEVKKCKVCENIVKFCNFNDGYNFYCSNKCSKKDPDVINKIKRSNKKIYSDENRKKEILSKMKNTFKSNYGTEWGFQSEKVKDKIKKTNIERYGTECPSKNNDVKDKIKNTNLERYGVEYTHQNVEILEKVKNTNLERYGFEWSSQNNGIKEKVLKTNIEKYGTKYPTQNDKVKEKTRNTNLERYGVEYTHQNVEIFDKFKNTNLERYGVEIPTKNKEIVDKIKKTNLERYGVSSVLEKNEIRDKFESIWFEKYDGKYPIQTNEIKNKIIKTRKDKFFKNLIHVLKNYNLELLDEEYIESQYIHNWKCTNCGNVFKQSWNEIQQGYLCPVCYPRNNGYSLLEKSVFDFLKENVNTNIIENSRNIIPPLELDIYIPEYKLAIEVDGLYWHSELFNDDKNYHLNKTNLCKEKGIRLIHIFEDEWLFKQDIVKNKLLHLLNLNNMKPKIYARNCIIKEIDPKIKNEFLDQFHIQGKDTSKIKLGAFYNDELVSVMTFNHGSISKGSKLNSEIWELNRFATNFNYHVIGIASKLLTYFKRNYEWSEIFTFADKRWSYGELYYILNFEHNYDNSPNYWYINNLKRIHRFNLRKRPDEPKDIPEWRLRLKEGYYRIWDCGTMKFSMIKGDL